MLPALTARRPRARPDSLTFYGIGLDVGELVGAGAKAGRALYASAALSALIEVPGATLGAALFEHPRLGRRRATCALYGGAGACCLLLPPLARLRGAAGAAASAACALGGELCSRRAAESRG